MAICVQVFHIVPSIQVLQIAHRKLQKYIYLTVQRNTFIRNNLNTNYEKQSQK